MSYRVDREKKLIDDAGNNTAVASAGTKVINERSRGRAGTSLSPEYAIAAAATRADGGRSNVSECVTCNHSNHRQQQQQQQQLSRVLYRAVSSTDLC